jgi:hypothetical protein
MLYWVNLCCYTTMSYVIQLIHSVVSKRVTKMVSPTEFPGWFKVFFQQN